MFLEQRGVFATLFGAARAGRAGTKRVSAQLEYLAYRYGFYEGHQAEADCLALLEVLQQPFAPTGNRRSCNCRIRAPTLVSPVGQ
jgi:hypothetical protein